MKNIFKRQSIGLKANQTLKFVHPQGYTIVPVGTPRFRRAHGGILITMKVTIPLNGDASFTPMSKGNTIREYSWIVGIGYFHHTQNIELILPV